MSSDGKHDKHPRLLELEQMVRDGRIDTIIVDHHTLPKELPEALILNPRLPDTPFPFIDLAAVGVAFNLVLALRNHLRDLGAFPEGRVPSLVEYLDHLRRKRLAA